MEMTRECAVCSDECKFKCSGCHARFYCGKPHQIQDWPSHSKSCYPFLLVQEIFPAERHLVAPRSIKALEIIFTEKPIVFGPVPSWHPQSMINGCPICYKVCSPQVFSCPECSIKMCSSTCHKHKDHIPECTFIKVAKPADRRKMGDSLTPYNLILLFRSLWLKHTDPNSWNLFLQIKNDATAAMAKEKDTDAEFLKYVYKLDNFSEEEINHASTALYNFSLYLDNGQAGIYPHFALLGHECSENTLAFVNNDREMVVKAACDIERNERLSKPGVFPFYGVFGRQLKRKTIFVERICICHKCQDPTDMGTYMSSIYCLYCGTGHLLPPILSQEEWRCESCGNPESNTMVASVLNEFQRKLDMATDVKSLNTFLENSKFLLCENHLLRLRAKYNLCGFYTKEMYANPKISEKYGTHLYSLAEEIIYVLCKVCPEYVVIRGTVYFHMLYPLLVNLTKVCNEKKRLDGKNFYKMTTYIKTVIGEDPFEDLYKAVAFGTEQFMESILQLLLSRYSKTN